ncbi:MAG: DUF1326 domain-containing protein [Planctomycetes bacterium]|nr:DUF1326 domain-containing protein [Planctomycetota bacterium]
MNVKPVNLKPVNLKVVSGMLCWAVASYVSGFAFGADPVIAGEYVEARTCDVWTGPCFANSEINTAGEFAIVSWAVSQGSWAGQDLSGLKIAAALRAQGTLTTEGEGKVKAIVYVDEKATPEQANALLSMARTLAKKYFENILEVHKSAISFQREEETATLEIKEVLKIRTKALSHGDCVCGNEKAAYPSISKLSTSECAKTVEHFFKGQGLQARWSDPFKRSAVIGAFALTPVDVITAAAH